MKLVSALALASCIFTTTANGAVYLDQSQGVFFDQFASNNFSLQLLQAKNNFNNQDFILGGSSEFDAQQWSGDKLITTPLHEYHQDNGLYFTQATFDVMSKLGDPVTIFLSAADSYIGSNNPGSDRVYSPHAFFLVGDLTKFPVYLTAGINDVPFGMFSNAGVWTQPLTASYFNPGQAPQLSAGFYKNNFNAVLTEYEDQTNYEKHAVYSLYYNNNIKSVNFNVGAGYLTNLSANAVGSLANQALRKQLARSGFGNVFDVNAGVNYSVLGLSGEYLCGSQKVTPNNNLPAAYALIISYQPNIFGKPTSFGLSRSVSLHLKDVPTILSGEDGMFSVVSGIKNNWVFGVSRPMFFKNLVLGIDLDKSITYANRKTYTGTLDFTAYL